MVCPPSRGLASPCLPLSPRVCACVGCCVYLPEVLSPTVSPHVCLCWMVRPPCQGFISPCLPLLSRMCACVGWCVHLPEVLSPIVFACLQLSPHMCACVGWCVRLPDVLSPLVSHYFRWLPTYMPVLDGSWITASCVHGILARWCTGWPDSPVHGMHLHSYSSSSSSST